MKLFLLVYDEFLKDYVLYSQFDDNQQGLDLINKITVNLYDYVVIKGMVHINQMAEDNSYDIF